MRGMSITNGFELIDPAYYAQNGPPHEIWTKLRAESPVHWCEVPGMEPFWAITRHADICAISRQPGVFLSEPGITIFPDERNPNEEGGIGAMRVVITMDPPEHRAVRKVASPWFTPRALKRIDAAVEQSARELVDELAGQTGEGETDLARGMAVSHPLRILSTALGVPREQEPKILELSQRLFAPDDPELGTGGGREEFDKLGKEFLELFLPIVQTAGRIPPTTWPACWPTPW